MMIVIASVLPFGIPTPLSAQPQLIIRDITTAWPEVMIDVSVKCNGAWSEDFEQKHFRVYEDGIEKKDITLVCPDRHTRCSITVALVLDASGSMAGDKNEQTRRAANEFVSNMDGISDRAAVIWFNSRDTLVQSLTSDTLLLKAAIDSLPAQGTTAVWDATWSGMQELVNNGSTDSCSAIIVLTDGNDNASVHGLTDVVLYARAHGIRVFTVGLGEDANGPALSALATQTGARYFHVQNASQLIEIYEDIFMDVAGLSRCTLRYFSGCADGTTRTVEVHLVDYCGGTVIERSTYTAPLDDHRMVGIDVAVSDTTVDERGDIMVPVRLNYSSPGAVFNPSTITIRFDTSIVQCDGLGSTAGCLLAPGGLWTSALPDGITVHSSRKVEIDTPGVLFTLRIRAKTVPQSLSTELRLELWEFDHGCLEALTKNGLLHIRAKEPEVTCSLSMPTHESWDVRTSVYSPDSVLVIFRVRNSGAKAAEDAAAELQYQSADFDLLGPSTTRQTMQPSAIPPSEYREVSWMLRAKPRPYRDTVQLCIRGTFSNHPPVTCCGTMIIDAAEPLLRCAVTAPPVTVDTIRLRYDPSPLPIRITVDNIGGKPAESVWAEIELSSPMRLADVSPPSRQLVSPSTLAGGQTGTAMWLVHIPIRTTPQMCDVNIRIISRTGDSTHCGVRIDIPPLDAPVLDAACTAPEVLNADSLRNTYVPNPFDVGLALRNIGNRSAHNILATLILPDGMVLTDSTETLRKPVVPTVLMPGITADSLRWHVRLSRRFTSDEMLPFAWVITGRSERGYTLDTAFNVCVTPVHGLPQRVMCRLVPSTESLIVDSTGAVTPTEVNIEATLTNVGSTMLHHVVAQLTWDTNHISFKVNPLQSDTSRTRRFALLAPGVSERCSWSLVCSTPTSIDSLSSVSFRLEAFSDEAEPDPDACTYAMQIIPLHAQRAALSCVIEAPDTVHFVDTAYVPSLLTTVTRVTNIGHVVVHGVRAFPLQCMRLTIADSAERRANAIYPGSIIEFSGRNALRFVPSPDQHSTWDTLRIVVVSNDAPPVLCTKPVYVEGTEVPMLTTTCILDADTVGCPASGGAPTPTRLHITAEVRNVGTPARDISLDLLLPPRLTLLDSTSHIDAGSLETGAVLSHTWTMQTVPYTSSGTDTIRVRVAGKGGLGNAIISELCMTKIVFDFTAESAATIICHAPDSIRINQRQQPFTTYAEIQNRQATMLDDAYLEVVLSAGLHADSGQSLMLPVGQLPPGAAVKIEIHLLADAYADPDASVCVALHNSQRILARCCASIRLVTQRSQVCMVSCAAPDSIHVTPSGDTYSDAPFVARVTVTNTGTSQLELVRMMLQLSPGLILLDPPERILSQPLDPGMSAPPECWRVDVPVGSKYSVESVRCDVVSDGDTTACISRIVIPPVTVQVLSCTLTPTPLDTLHFLYPSGDFEGIRSATGEYSVFSVDATISNRAAIQTHAVTATLLLPEGVSFDEGQHAAQLIDVLSAGETFRTRWNLRASRAEQGALRTFVLRTTDDAGHGTHCDDALYIQGAPRIAQLTLPQFVATAYGSRITLPVDIDLSRAGAMNSYRLAVSWDPTVLRLRDADNNDCLTDFGWRGPKIYTSDTQHGIAVISDTAMTFVLHDAMRGALVRLTFDAVFGSGSDQLSTAISNVVVQSSTSSSTGSEGTSPFDSFPRFIRILGDSSTVTVSGSCIQPVLATDGYLLENAPNPFNPTTVLSFAVPSHMHAELRVFDALGRIVIAPFAGECDAGRHEIILDAAAWPAGVYIARLDTPRRTLTRQLLLAK